MSPDPLLVFEEIHDALISLDNLALLQRITGLVYTPRPESVRIRFNTNLPATAVVEIFQYVSGVTFEDWVPERLVATRMELFGGARLRHDFELDPLPQDTRLWFKVTATSADPYVRRAYGYAQFLTLSRTVRVRFDELLLWRSGDSDSPGEMLFKGAAYDYATKTMILGPFRRPSKHPLPGWGRGRAGRDVPREVHGSRSVAADG